MTTHPSLLTADYLAACIVDEFHDGDGERSEPGPDVISHIVGLAQSYRQGRMKGGLLRLDGQFDPSEITD